MLIMALQYLWGKYNAHQTAVMCYDCGGTGSRWWKCNKYSDYCSIGQVCHPTIQRPYTDYNMTCPYGGDGVYNLFPPGSTAGCPTCNNTGVIRYIYSKGTYLTTVTANQNTFPSNGRHADGYWYVYVGLANKTPTITGTDTDLGEVAEISYSYTVDDEDLTDTLIVVERLDGVELRTFTPVRGTEYTVNLSANWVEILNGTHDLTITVTDNFSGTQGRTITFTKAEHEIEFTLATPLECDAMVLKTIMSITKDVPTSSLMQVYVCNNGNDLEPTWEDITQQIKDGEKFFFANTEKTAETWGYNIKVSIQRLSGEGDCYITSVGGNFE